MPRFTLPLAAGLLALAAVPARAQTDSTRVPADSARAASPAPAQSPAAATGAATHGLAEGDDVRIVSGAGRYAGTLLRVTADTFVVRAVGRQDAVVRSDVTSMQRLAWREPRRGAILRGAAVGLVAGTVTGLLLGLSTANYQDCAGPSGAPCNDAQDKTILLSLTGLGSILGTLTGAMIGPTFRRSHWEHVDPRPLSVP